MGTCSWPLIRFLIFLVEQDYERDLLGFFLARVLGGWFLDGSRGSNRRDVLGFFLDWVLVLVVSVAWGGGGIIYGCRCPGLV